MQARITRTRTMSVRTGHGWQLLLADLSLILFMITAGALSQTWEREDGARRREVADPGTVSADARSAPLALYRDAPGAPPLARWLAAQRPDPRQQLTIVVQYRPGAQAAALAQARAQLGTLGTAGAAARIVVEPGDDATTATLAFDAPTDLAYSPSPDPRIATSRSATSAKAIP